MPYGYTPPAWADTPQASSPIVGGSYSRDERDDRDDRGHPGGWINEPSATFSPPPDHPSNAGTPIVTTNEIINEKLPGNLPIIQDLGSSNLEKLLTDEERKLNMLYELQNQWEGSGSSIRHDYDEDYSTYPISSPFALSGEELYDSEWYSTDSTNPYGLSYHGTTKYDDQGNIISGTKMGDPGAVLLNAKAVSFGHPPVYGKPILSGIGEELYNYDWTDGGKNPYGTIPNPEEIYFGEEGPSPILEKIEGISRNYHGQPWDSWEDPFWGGHEQPAGEMDSLADYARHHWFSESLSDVERREQQRLEEGLGLATMSDMEQMYGPDFAADANPFFDPKFSYKYTGDMSPLGAGMELFGMAKETKEA
tara:strand:- start:26 stop:1117 length:1092 start_codon:yes stop_codon:yes gene_type:complete